MKKIRVTWDLTFRSYTFDQEEGEKEIDSCYGNPGSLIIEGGMDGLNHWIEGKVQDGYRVTPTYHDFKDGSTRIVGFCLTKEEETGKEVWTEETLWCRVFWIEEIPVLEIPGLQFAEA